MTRFLDRPLDASFYERVRRTAGSEPETRLLDGFEGLALDVDAGSLLSIELLDGPQIVSLFAFNRNDPLERIWHQSLISESVFLTPFARIWGTLPRYRPLLTMIDDSLADRLGPGHAHHPVLGGAGTPADWRALGGRPHAKTTWEQLAGLLAARGLRSHLLTQDVSLFQRSRIDPGKQRIDILPSLATAGDRVALFAEIDLCVLLALSPYLDGGQDPGDPAVGEPAPIRIGVTPATVAPLGWPYAAAAGDLEGARPTSRRPVVVPTASARDAPALRHARFPFDEERYHDLAARRAGFELRSRRVVAPNTGYGFRVEAGDTFAFELVEGAQIVDVCILNADDPTECFATGPQLAIEGGRIECWTRLWGNPPRSRPLATCILDTVGDRAPAGLLAHHICHSDCCSGPFWLAVSGEERRSCYDNICDGLELLGLDASAFQANVNLFMSAALDPETGDLVEGHSAGIAGDRIELFAEIPLHVAISVCPAGAGGPPERDRESVPRPVAVEIARTSLAPREWTGP